MTSVAFDHDLVELLGDEPELLAIADAIAATQTARRLRPAGRRRLTLAAAAALAIVVAAPALGLHRTIISFFESEPAPERAQLDFGRMSVVPVGIGPDVVPGGARKILERELEGKRRSLYVAPTESGGFCWTWSKLTSSCGRLTDKQGSLGVTWLEGPNGATSIMGHLLDPEIEKLELRYEDGTREEIPFVWVSPPIDAGFYGYQMPEGQLREGHRAQTLVALDADGDQIVSHPFHYSDPRWESGPDGLPKVADRSQLRTLFNFRDRNGVQRHLRVAPAPGDKLCYAYNNGGGCRSPKFPGSVLNLGVQGGGTSVFVCCEVGADAATVVLRFEGGHQIELPTVKGFLLYELTLDRYTPGRRLNLIISRDANGREIGRRVVEPSRSVYPCAREDEIDLGFETTICP